MPNPIDSFCSRCGVGFESTDEYPRQCLNSDCGAQTWANPVPVSVILVPVVHGERTGLLVIRRGIEPRMGRLALVGGFVDAGETWQSAGAREVFEESGVELVPESITPFWFTSTEPNPNRVLLFGATNAVSAGALPAFAATDETTERGLVFGPGGLDDVFAFGLHAEAARRWFTDSGITGDNDYVEI